MWILCFCFVRGMRRWRGRERLSWRVGRSGKTSHELWMRIWMLSRNVSSSSSGELLFQVLVFYRQLENVQIYTIIMCNISLHIVTYPRWEERYEIYFCLSVWNNEQLSHCFRPLSDNRTALLMPFSSERNIYLFKFIPDKNNPSDI